MSNTFMSKTRLKFAKIKPKLRNTLKLDFCYLKTVTFNHSRFYYIASGY